MALGIAGLPDSEWVLDCECPTANVRQQLPTRPRLNWPVPGAPSKFMAARRHGVSLTLMPDIIQFNEAGVSSMTSYSFSPETRGLKGELLKRLGMVEIRSRGFGPTLRFSAAPNWALQFKGTKRVTVAYITRF